MNVENDLSRAAQAEGFRGWLRDHGWSALRWRGFHAKPEREVDLGLTQL
jgi:hypothetical protein